MKTLIQLEEAGMLVLAYVLSLVIGYDWWVFLVFLLVPDLSMLGYLFGTKAGAWLYNVFHFRTLAIAVGIIGYFISVPEVMLIGILLFGHSSMDRIFGYGLKYSDDFKNTHLGKIGEGKNR
ncbi:DUF4260 domain-containing protein [Mariniphaga sp.]|uniref:DUF4260 domain-containing protein n=1 Tax=Mariniphaga sp. TaxID=1954475 RepID=UPI00356AEA61